MRDAWSATVNVWMATKNNGRLRDDTHAERDVLIAYDTSTPNPGGAVCNQIATSGAVCRLWRDHHEWDHLPVDPLLLMESGVYVIKPYEP